MPDAMTLIYIGIYFRSINASFNNFLKFMLQSLLSTSTGQNPNKTKKLNKPTKGTKESSFLPRRLGRHRCQRKCWWLWPSRLAQAGSGWCQLKQKV